MTFEDFKAATRTSRPPSGLPAPLLALWHDARGDWVAAHETAQAIEPPLGSWIRAYLHRKEGDLANAGYWYRRAGQPEARDDLDVEWQRIAASALEQTLFFCSNAGLQVARDEGCSAACDRPSGQVVVRRRQQTR